jgi:hypothetical protein
MGFNFVAGSPWDLFEDDLADRYVEELRLAVAESVPLGRGIPEFVIRDEMGWSWWSELQAFARERLGREGSAQIGAVDAFEGVYVDADIDRRLLWPNGKPERTESPIFTMKLATQPWYRRPLQWLGLAPNSEVSPEIQSMMTQMIADYGARAGEFGALQVGNLRRLHDELSELAVFLGHDATQGPIEDLRRLYCDDEDRCDDDPEIQCLCHAWITSRYALDHGVPMWLLK